MSVWLIGSNKKNNNKILEHIDGIEWTEKCYPSFDLVLIGRERKQDEKINHQTKTKHKSLIYTDGEVNLGAQSIDKIFPETMMRASIKHLKEAA